MEIGRDDVVIDYNDDSLYEAIDLHNEHVDKMLELGRVLLEKFDEDDPVIEKFVEVFNSAIATSIFLCCEANSREDNPVWMTTEEFFVVREDEE